MLNNKFKRLKKLIKKMDMNDRALFAADTSSRYVSAFTDRYYLINPNPYTSISRIRNHIENPTVKSTFDLIKSMLDMWKLSKTVISHRYNIDESLQDMPLPEQLKYIKCLGDIHFIKSITAILKYMFIPLPKYIFASVYQLSSAISHFECEYRSLTGKHFKDRFQEVEGLVFDSVYTHGENNYVK
jgi:hypothetical protein